ncbi:AAA family ATPase [Rhodococcus qingshengii]|uniref:AAA family ATPase n=1 Tax=Rhodococcus qingshengii TaxID=334542 RepID=UPI001C60025D|nr:ATP-binding protein [Rhodococcus qingshengii]MBW4818437.1 ATP-binding protein [Rhodococcus qingshengii]
MSSASEAAVRKTKSNTEADIVQLARLALAARHQDVEAYLQRLVRRYRESEPQIADALRDLLRNGALAGAPLRSAPAPAPVDADSRMALLRPDMTGGLAVTPILQEAARDGLFQLRDERLAAPRLERAGLLPSRTALFTGPPGVGKTMSARWLADELKLPLLVLDLSAVMSSLLGKTGTNLRRVLDYAKQQPSILLLDELDAVAKRRNDATEVGELKRLVTVLIQEIDDWPATSLLLAATNHPELLDPAIWRRFDYVIPFDLPAKAELAEAVEQFTAPHQLDPALVACLSVALEGSSFSDVERMINASLRRAAINGTDLNTEVLAKFHRTIEGRPAAERRDLAVALVTHKVLSQRRASELTGVSRDTIRTHMTTIGEVGRA